MTTVKQASHVRKLQNAARIKYLAYMKTVIGKVYGRLTVLEYIDVCKDLSMTDNRNRLKCRCSCGNVKILRAVNVLRGLTVSCGCASRDRQQRGALNSAWKGGRTRSSRGYYLLRKPEHPNAAKSGYVMEHVVIMSQHLGRPLTADEIVHHRNGIKHDNRLDNLELMTKSTHFTGQRISDVTSFAIKHLQRYCPELITQNKEIIDACLHRYGAGSESGMEAAIG